MHKSVLVCAAVLVFGGCAHYRLGAGPPEDEAAGDDPSVSVATVGVPADWGVDAPRLTRQLVESLRSEGFTDVAWRDGAGRNASVECVVDGPAPESLGVEHAARVVARCSVTGPAGPFLVRTRGRRTVAGEAERGGLATVRHSSLEYAAAEALSEAAPAIATRLRR